jgi:high affinity Mn2+ porin
MSGPKLAPRFPLKALALAVLLATGGAHAATPQSAQDKLLAELKRLAERVDKLEKRNAELEARVAAAPKGPADPILTERVSALEKSNQELAAALESDRISEKEPELATRLKALETKTDSHGPAAKLAEALDGIKVEGSVAAVTQGVNGNGRTNGKDQTAVNWRGDIGITLPGGDIGAGKGEFFTHLRVGQGKGVTDLVPTFTSTTNSLLFQQEGVPSSNTNAIVAEAWYQLTTPLGEGGENSPHTLQFTVGKIDPFVFFDQNAIADNEAQKFLNNTFVHNPMLDSGGAMGMDDYGFTPGLRLAYRNETSKSESWQASVAVFGAGEGADFGNSFTQPMVIGQLEFNTRLFGLPGTYRVYAWNNPQYEGYDGSTDKNLGWGLSLDQQVHEDLSLFTRLGYTMSGKVTFDRAVTVGAELSGDAWGRGADRVGLAFGWLRSSSGFRNASAGLADFGYAADGAEKDAELYYRYHVNEHVSLTPDLQVIQNPGANPDADTVTAVGVRALYAF